MWKTVFVWIIHRYRLVLLTNLPGPPLGITENIPGCYLGHYFAGNENDWKGVELIAAKEAHRLDYLLAYQEFDHLKPIDLPRTYQPKEGEVMECQHEGCKRENVNDCVPEDFYLSFMKGTLLDHIDHLPVEEREKILDSHLKYYCVEHAPEHHFCLECGHYRYQLNEEGVCLLCQMKPKLEEFPVKAMGSGA